MVFEIIFSLRYIVMSIFKNRSAKRNTAGRIDSLCYTNMGHMYMPKYDFLSLLLILEHFQEDQII